MKKLYDYDIIKLILMIDIILDYIILNSETFISI